MNETEFLNQFNDFEEIEVADTYTTRIIQQAKELEGVLNEVPYESLSELDRFDLKLLAKEYVAGMSQECPYLDQQVTVFGPVTTGTYDEVTNSYSTADVTHESHTVTFAGFDVMLVETPRGSGVSRYVVGHTFLSETLAHKPSGLPLVSHIPLLYSFAPVGSVDIVTDASESRQGDSLHKIIPDILEDVNNEIGQADSSADALCRLRHIIIDDMHDTIPTDVVDKLLKYAYDSLGMDEEVPYIAQLRGAAYRGELGSRGGLAFEHFDNSSAPMLVVPVELRLAFYPKKTNGGFEMGDSSHFTVKLRVLGEHAGEAERTIFAPVRNIKSFDSLRGAVNEPQGGKWYRV